jgi:hypothetical protein
VRIVKAWKLGPALTLCVAPPVREVIVEGMDIAAWLRM